METNQPAVQPTAPALIGVNPIGDFIKTLPETASIFGCKCTRSAGEKSINIAYFENGKQYYAWCRFIKGNAVSADIEVVSGILEGGVA